MKRLSILKAALPMLLVGAPLLADDVVEIHGYTRAGVGRSSNGGEQVTFQLANTGGSPTGGPGYRLGNETDNYLELAVDVKAYEKGSTNFKLHFRPAFREYYGMRDASSDAGGDADHSMTSNKNQQIWVREGWGEAVGIFGDSGAFKDASLWIGRRFYMRQDLHMRDQWYWNNSGDGFGIEQINLGFGKLHYAYIQHDLNNVSNQDGASWNNGALTGVVNPYSPWLGNGGPGTDIVGSHDLRLSDIKLWEGGSLTLGIQYNDAHPTAKSEANYEAANGGAKDNHKGTQYSLLWNQANVLGGDNKVFIAYGNGSTFWNWYNPRVPTGNTWYHVMEMLYIKPAANFDLMGSLQYRKQNGVKSDNFDMTGNSNTWTSAGVRPTFFFNKHVSLAAEIGYDKLKFDNEAEDRHLLKKTLALQFSPQASSWSRPVLRLFVTQANWNKNANNWNLIGDGRFGSDTQGLTYGAQVEAWW